MINEKKKKKMCEEIEKEITIFQGKNQLCFTNCKLDCHSPEIVMSNFIQISFRVQINKNISFTNLEISAGRKLEVILMLCLQIKMK